MKMHHLGLAVSSIPSALAFLQSVVNVESVSETVFDREQNANLCMVNVRDGTAIELIEGEFAEKMIKKGQFFYHSCWETDDMEKELRALTEKGGMIISPPKPAALFGDRKVAFIMTEIGLLELLEE